MTTGLLAWGHPQTTKQLLAVLESNKIALTTTDTVPGLLSAATAEAATALAQLKGDRAHKPFLVLAASTEAARALVDPHALHANLQQLLDHCWPGPVTLILPANPGLPAWMCSPERTIAIRVPTHEGLQTILAVIPVLFSTSANRSNQPTPATLAQVDNIVRNAVACVVGNASGIPESATPIPSTILDCTQPTIRVVRTGIYPLAPLEHYYGTPFIR